MSFIRSLALVPLLALSISGCSDRDQSADNRQVLTIYTERKEHLIKPLLDEFTRQTGVTIRYITDGAGPLIARLDSEKDATPADMLITVDAGSLWQASEKGLLKSIESTTLEDSIPQHLRSPDNQWFGLSARARTIVYSTERVTPDALSTYEALADPEWKGRLCLRTAKKVYNQSLVATMINTQGAEKTEETVRGWVANLATAPYSDDTMAMEAVVAGQCDVTLVNTYYLGRMQQQNPDLPLAIFWPNQEDRGVHVNISGAGVTRHAKNAELAQQLLEWFASPDVQYRFAEANQEFPANQQVEPAPLVKSWGTFKADLVNVEAAGRLQQEAIMLMDRAGYR